MIDNGIRRINLCFNINNKRAEKVYNTILEHSSKTAFIIDAVLAYMDEKDIDKNMIKQAVKEALEEVGGNISIDNKIIDYKEDEGIPDDIFNIISGL